MQNNNSCKVTFSLVLYKQDLDELRKVLQSILLYKGEKKIFVVDNSPADYSASQLCEMDACIVYEHLSQNVGFGKAHNWAIAEAAKLNSQFHVIVNPDINYAVDVVEPMLHYMEQHPEIGEMMPRILYPNGKEQYLPKLMPTPKMLVARRIKKLLPKVHAHYMERFEMRGMRHDQVYDVGHVSGCFAMFRMEALQFAKGFDDRFFMYFEDTDLSRRIHARYRTVYYPMVTVNHDYGNGASRNTRLFFIFLTSLAQYFNKWGWMFDKERRVCNKNFLKQINL